MIERMKTCGSTSVAWPLSPYGPRPAVSTRFDLADRLDGVVARVQELEVVERDLRLRLAVRYWPKFGSFHIWKYLTFGRFWPGRRRVGELAAVARRHREHEVAERLRVHVVGARVAEALGAIRGVVALGPRRRLERRDQRLHAARRRRLDERVDRRPVVARAGRVASVEVGRLLRTAGYVPSPVHRSPGRAGRRCRRSHRSVPRRRSPRRGRGSPSGTGRRPAQSPRTRARAGRQRVARSAWKKTSRNPNQPPAR